MVSTRYQNLVKRVENIAFITPKDYPDNIRNYFFLCGEAHRILTRLGHVRTMEMPENIALESIESQVKELEEKIERLK